MLSISTKRAGSLLLEIKMAINEGHIETWTCDSEGDFTHSPSQWSEKAWLRPVVKPDALEFGIIPPKDTVLEKEIYGIYHGRFLEMLLSHFSKSFQNITVSAIPKSPDTAKVK